MISPRRYGKSSLVNEVLKKISLSSIVVDLETINSELELAHVLMRKLLKGRPFEKISQFFQDFKIKPVLSFDPSENSLEFSYNASARDAQQYCVDAFSLAQKLGSDKKPLVIVFDEFQEIRRIGKKLERTLRGVFQHHTNVCYIFIGSNRHMISDIFQNQSNPFYKFGKHITLQRISYDDFYAYLEDKFSLLSLDTTKMSEEILSLSGNHPYYTQQLAFEVYTLLMEGERANVVQAAVNRIVVNHNAEFAQWWRARNNTDRKVLVGLAKNDFSYGTKDFLDANELNATSTVISALERMYNAGILEQSDDGRYFIEDIFFEAWIKYRRNN